MKLLNNLKIVITALTGFVFLSTLFSESALHLILNIFGFKRTDYDKLVVIFSFAVAYPWAVLGLKSLLNKFSRKKLFSGLDEYKIQDNETAMYIAIAIVFIVGFSVYMTTISNVLNIRELLAFWAVAFIMDLLIAIDIDDKGINPPIQLDKLLIVLSVLKDPERQEVIDGLVQFQNSKLMEILNIYSVSQLQQPININLGQSNQNQLSRIKSLIDEWQKKDNETCEEWAERREEIYRKEMNKSKNPPQSTEY